MNTSESLIQLGRKLLGEMVADICSSGKCQPRFRFYRAGEEANTMKLPPELLHVMNIGPAKDLMFDMFRGWVDASREAGFPIDATAFATDMWKYQSTEKERPEVLAELVKLVSMADLVAAGSFTSVAILNVFVQSEEHAIMINQPYLRRTGTFVFETIETDIGLQADFTGRMKMFGDTREENLFTHRSAAR